MLSNKSPDLDLHNLIDEKNIVGTSNPTSRLNYEHFIFEHRKWNESMCALISLHKSMI